MQRIIETKKKALAPISKHQLADFKTILNWLMKNHPDYNREDLEGLARVLEQKGVQHMEENNREYAERKRK